MVTPEPVEGTTQEPYDAEVPHRLSGEGDEPSPSRPIDFVVLRRLVRKHFQQKFLTVSATVFSFRLRKNSQKTSALVAK
jgi:hypothetical protein